ncbi:hypothetical protein [Micromonospora yangpuensis]|uniref:DUF3558 domain-containing protein n=1 Tax=Micromonospora yangpuensis TaxID=683228 RepID=A0A1C6UD52_9ACTN|nr:hypothetical protein [Micromonospora yangpuensis]GGM26771.1 hypothetical protein GCM10012279_51600 [Micromonospora yangpuensis]SCL51976.1 hypothetical protein GA0070617_1939 [Micromonospora yangpuensis]
MRGRVWIAGAAVLLVSGCAAKDDAEPVAVPPVGQVTIPVEAAAAGGACRLLDFAVIEEHTGIRFEVAAASERTDTQTCVVRTGQESLPELTLSVSETAVDKETFTADVVPSRAEKVTDLGEQAYRRTLAASGDDGAAAEVGWLAGKGRLAVLRCTLPPETDRAADELATGLADLARTVDLTPTN